ncbi:hypothetical protein [Paenisporosarcina indica]|uniref:hypothetical protein n=1 Tax=Paenisporosarcina indica TaxID=650093 RepID=UPI00094FBF60|nr:hypothetical protein [Paenisporosarcina indica]
MPRTMKYISLGIVLLMIVFQFWIVLNEQRTPSSSEWSRSFPSNVPAGDYAKIGSVPNEKGYAISLLNFKKMDLLQCSEEMQCTNTWSKSEVDPYKNTWSDGDTTYFITKDDSFIHSTSDDGDTEISPNVENFSKSDQTLVYWLTDQQVMIQQDDNQPVTYKTEFPIYTTLIADEHVFVVTQNIQKNLYIVLDGTNDFKELFQFRLSPNESISTMLISSDYGIPGKYRLLLDMSKSSGGSITKVIRDMSFDLSEHQTADMSKLTFVDRNSDSNLFNVRNVFLQDDKTGTKITFSALMYDSYGEIVNKVFTGNYDDLVIEADAVTKKGDAYINPIFVNDGTIAYFRLDGDKKHLMYSSSSDAKIAQSADGLKGDVKESLFTLISLVFNGLVLILLSITWLIPTLILGYGTLSLLNKLYKPYAYTVAFYVNTIALVVSQLVLFNTLFNSEQIVSKAPYLTEAWHVSVVIIISGLLSILPVLLTRTKVNDDNFNMLILYTSGINLVCLFFLLGPYFL